jgi:hypothetical protein
VRSCQSGNGAVLSVSLGGVLSAKEGDVMSLSCRSGRGVSCHSGGCAVMSVRESCCPVDQGDVLSC